MKQSNINSTLSYHEVNTEPLVYKNDDNIDFVVEDLCSIF